MNHRRNLFRRLRAGVGLAAVLILAGCEQFPRTRAAFAGAAINGQPAHLMLDTGAPTTGLTEAGVRKFGLNFTPLPVRPAVRGERKVGLAEGARVAVGGETFAAPLLVTPGERWDGSIGWPDIRDNILVFDAARRTIRSVPALPPETAGWLKLKLHRGDYLGLDLLLPDGGTGTILVDTGAPHGVALPPAQRKAWRLAYPRAPATTESYEAPGSGVISFEEAWADEIKLGALTLTDVPVREAVPFEVNLFNRYAGTLGMYALARLDLVVDGPNGFAYLRPRPPPGPPYPGISRPADKLAPAEDPPGNTDWTVADNVRLNPGHLFFSAANYKARSGDFKGAIADYNRAIALDPKNADAYAYRGAAKIYTGDDGTADWNRALELDPQNTGVFLNRGLARQNEGDFAGALADFDRGIAQQPDGPAYLRLRLFRQLLQLRLERTAVGSAPVASGRAAGWGVSLERFAAGSLNEIELLAAAAQGDAPAVRQQQGEAFYFIGLLRLIKGDQEGARVFWQRGLALGGPAGGASQFARDELARLDGAAAK